MKKNRKEKKFWINLAIRWKKIPCPMHPWPSEIKIYQKFISEALKGIKKPKILVLGSTPEMHDLALNIKNSEVTCVDADLNMLLAMQKFMKNKNMVEEEIWVRSDWLKMPLAENYYHLILGDSVLPNVRFNLWTRFLKHLSKLLKINGFFVSRVVIKPIDNWIGKSLKEIFQYAKINRLNSEELRYLLFARIWKPNIKELGDKDVFRSIKKFWRDKERKFCYPDLYIQKLLNKIKENHNWPPKSDYRWSNRSKKDSEKFLRKYFKIVKVEYGKGESSFSLAYHPIYLLKKK